MLTLTVRGALATALASPHLACPASRDSAMAIHSTAAIAVHGQRALAQTTIATAQAATAWVAHTVILARGMHAFRTAHTDAGQAV
jgi:hypothetical protein